MKILWLSNVIISNDISNTGTWIIAMANYLKNIDNIKLVNITYSHTIKTIINNNYENIEQWIIPEKVIRRYIHNNNSMMKVKSIIDKLNPDIIHIWGTEKNWGLIYCKYFYKYKAILEIQGLLYEYQKYYYGGLSLKDLFRCIGLMEILGKHRILYSLKNQYKYIGEKEKYLINNISNISTQSEWVRASISLYQSENKIYNNSLLLRNQFLNSDKWKIPIRNNPILYVSSSGPLPYKGIHVILKALPLIIKKYKNIELHIIGAFQNKIKSSGYTKYLNRIVKQYKLENNVKWLGSLNAEEIIKELKISNVAIFPSYIETYCLALEEALYLGVPSVISYAGALPELALEANAGLYYSPGDETMCANLIIKILNNNNLAETLSKNAIKASTTRINVNNIVQKQIEIYNDVLS